MNSFIQVISFIISFLYGIIFYLLARFNKFILNKKNNFIRFLVSLVFVIDMVIIYVYLMYKVNMGMIHIYFIITVVIGFVFMALNYIKLQSICKKCVNKLKLKLKF